MDFDFVRGATAGGAIGLGVAGLVVLLLVRNLFSKLLTLLVIVALAAGVLYYRSSLDDCVKTCSCRLGPTHIQVNGHGCNAKR
jgi:hypothetical protein